MSSQTLSPFLKGVNVFFCLSAILLMASLCAANASSLSQMRLCIHCSIKGYFVFLNVIGMVLGDLPSMSSKGENVSCQRVVGCCGKIPQGTIC